jgi:hypothetical protein
MGDPRASRVGFARGGDLDQAGFEGRSVMHATLTGYGIGVVIVLAILNGICFLVGSPRLHDVNVFSAGFVLGILGMRIAAYLYGYRKVA